GGHSLKATSLASRISKEFNVKIPLGEIFKRPTIRGFFNYINGAVGERFIPIEAVEEKEYYILSSAQKRLYFLQQMDNAGTTYNISAAWIMEGVIDKPVLEQSIAKLIHRHESLRTSFVSIGEEPVQRIHVDVPFEIEYFDLAVKDVKDGEDVHHSSFIIHHFIRPFDLTNAPLIRVGLAKIEEEKHIFLVDMHHIISDGMSTQVLVQDFSTLYSGKEMPEMKIKYKDYAEWQNREKVSKKLGEQSEYWKKEYEGEIPVLELPTDYARHAVQNFEGDRITFGINSETSGSLKALAVDSGATLYMVLLALYTIFLSKLSNQEDIIIGSPLAGRSHADLEKIIGMFVNTLALRNYPAGEKKFTDFLEEVKGKTLNAFDNQEYQYEDLVENVAVTRDLSRNPLFDTMLVLQNFQLKKLEIPGLKLTPYEYENKTTKFDLTLTVMEVEEKLLFTFEYSTKLFREENIKRFTRYFKNILRGIIKNKDRRISNFEIITEEEKKRILFDFNDTEREYPGDKTIHQLFEEQSARTPNHIAIVGADLGVCLDVFGHGQARTNEEEKIEEETFGGVHLSYRQLNEQVGRLAWLLIERGVLAGDIVGIMMERCVEMVIGILGILKSGGAYLPIDPEYPRERIEYMLKDSSAKLLITTNDKEGEKVRRWEGEKVLLESIIYHSNHHSFHHSSFIIHHPGNLAYIMYTSGTTGKPKGVMVTHKNVVRLVMNTNYIDLSGENRILQTGAPVFDAATFEIWGALLQGGELVLVGNDIILDADKLGNALTRYRIITLWLTSSLFNQLMEQNNTIFSGLKNLLVGGDVLSPRAINMARSKNTELKIINGYGPTENTTFSTTYPVDEDFLENIPIGKPIHHSMAYILDKHGYQQPVGVVGELYLGGDGVSRGYLNDPELTAEKFGPQITLITQINEIKKTKINKSFAGVQGGLFQKPPLVFYKTGDLARWRPDGNIEFMGRRDNQVKIRGFRIELGEIENLLLRHHDMGGAVVLSREDKTNDHYLCAYIVPRNTGAFDKTGTIFSGLREYLSQSLPEYMIPRYFIELEKIPLNPNGKIDRKSLTELQVSNFEFNKYIAPRDETEEKLTLVWSEVLSVEKEKISIDANFFELGGHSLKATKLVTKVHKEFNIKLPLAEVFRTPTILGLAKYIKGTVAETYLSITPTEKKEYYGLSSAQKRLYLLLQMEPKSTVYNITSAILLEGKLEKKRLEETFKKLIMRHESLRTSFYLIDGIPAQVVHESVDFEPGYYEIEAEDEPAVNAQIENLIRNVTPFDLTKPPLMKVNLIKVAEMKHYLVFDMHHIISDGTSSAIFIKEFTALYDRVELPPLRIRYSDYSEWQNREKEKERIKKQEEYWLKRFEGEVPILKLPTDFSRPRMQSFEGKRTFFNISEADTAALNRLALEQETTLYTVLLSLYYILLHKLGQQEDIVIGAPTAGRVHADLQDLIGMFLNTLTLRYYPQPGKTFITFLSEVKTGVLDALENQEYQFDELVDKLELKRDTGRNPLFDVMFILQNMEMPEIQISGLKIKSTDYMTGTTKFDLSLYAVGSGQVIHFNFNFSTKLFESATIEIFINYFKNIISSVLKNPGINIADIEYVSEKDRADIVKHFNRDLWQEAETVLAGKKVFQEKLNEISAKYPDHTAIEYDRKTLTYSQLDLRSNYVANWIVDQGITKQTFIGILIDERAELITTVLGIIKAGCVFVSLDSSYPDQRLETMMETTGMKIIMVDKTNNHRFAGNETVKKQNVEFRIFETLFLNAHLNPSWFVDKTAVEYDPGDRLYILFTSGTTGKPKAIMGRNSGLLHYISWEIKKFDIKNGFRIGQLAIPSFDPFLRDVFVPLCSGGVVCIPGNKDIVMDSVALRKWLEKVRIQLIHCVPVLFKLINSAPLTAANLKDLKFILLAGEKAVPSVLADWYAIFDERIRLVNLLGPTETTQAKICYLIQKDDIKRVRIPVGKPMEGAAVILLDDRLNVCGLLEKGEICIRTPFRSCGYFGDDELNKRKFIQNPFSDEPGDIVYRTGDMGMFLPDGKLDFVGREDRQVKIRGRRIELEEIENVLLRHPAVREAAITKIETANNDELLCAYVAENAQYAGDEKLFTETLPGYLAERLPDYMVPANMVKIEKIPRNTNGKVDYRKLPDPFAENQKERIAPRDEIEKRILKTWIELLKLETIGVTDNFFNSGGSSLTAISLTHKIHKEFDVHLALEDVFQNPTIEEQAKLIRAAIKEKYTSIEKAPERDYYKLSSAQKRLYIIWSIDPQNTAYNISKAIAIEGELDRDRLDKTFKELTERHESFRTTFLIKDEEPVQEIQKEVTLPIRYTDARGMREEELKEEVDKMIEKFLAPFDLSKAPLLRVELIEIREKKYILLVDMHHIISDGTSLGILIKDFMSLYRGEKLTPLRLQYKDYSEWESRLFESGKMDAQEEFWLKILEEELPVLKLPLDFQRPKISGFRQSTLDFSLGEKLSAKVKQLAGETGATLHILLLAIYNILLAKYSGQEDILVGSGIVGRKHEDLKNIIGMFVNILVMRNRPGEDKTFKKFLEEVRSNAVNTYENQDYPFDRLVMKLGIEREYGRNPVFDTIFQFHNLEMETFDIPGLKLKSYEYKKPFTQFDLSLDGIDNGDMVIMWFSYAVELFKESTVVDLKKHYEEILEQVVENREIKLKDITLSHRLKDGKSDLSKKESMDFGF
ncbi:MAG TPA: amino acid adenylation domain-containing protein, partial [Candidatus Kapabacteria bacterium]|nr:amino acid adenylation domain-containing protein [Candidatus Kapabacteria bacterium]